MSSIKFFKGQEVVRTSGNFGRTREGHVYKVRENCEEGDSLYLEDSVTGEHLTGSYDSDLFELQIPTPTPAQATRFTGTPIQSNDLEVAVKNCKELKELIKELQVKYEENLRVISSHGLKFIEEV